METKIPVDFPLEFKARLLYFFPIFLTFQVEFSVFFVFLGFFFWGGWGVGVGFWFFFLGKNLEIEVPTSPRMPPRLSFNRSSPEVGNKGAFSVLG